MTAPRGVQRLVLLRHGRTASNAEGRFQGHLDVDLDEVGHAQAAAVARWWGEVLADVAARRGVRVVSSDLSRARQTAEPLATVLGVELELDAALRERDVGAWEGLARAEIQAAFPQEYARWTGAEDIAIGGGETLNAAWRRWEAAVRRHLEVGGAEVLVAVGHGAAMRGGMLRLIGMLNGRADLATYRRVGGFGNCHWSELRRREQAWVLQAHNVSAPSAPVG